LNVALWPAATTCGCAKPITCKLELDPVTELIVTEEVELLVSVSCRDLLVPTGTVPKFKLAFVSVTPPPLPELLFKIWQPDNSSSPMLITNNAGQTRRLGYKFKSASKR
jgi:hypothetical protein